MKSEHDANLALSQPAPSWTKPAPKRGRRFSSATEATKPRSVRLNDARWARLKLLGREWLERAIDASD